MSNAGGGGQGAAELLQQVAAGWNEKNLGIQGCLQKDLHLHTQTDPTSCNHDRKSYFIFPGYLLVKPQPVSARHISFTVAMHTPFFAALCLILPINFGTHVNTSALSPADPVKLAEPLPEPLPASTRPPTHWLLVNRAHAILRVRVDRVSEITLKRPQGHRLRRVSVISILKGAEIIPSTAVPPIVAPRDGIAPLDLCGYPPAKEWKNLRRHQGKEVILFLVSSGEEFSNRTWHLESDPLSIQNFTTKLESDLRSEIEHQKALAAAVRSHLAISSFPKEEMVHRLIARLLDPKTYQRVPKPREEKEEPLPLPVIHSYPEIIEEFEGLGEDAIPAIVKVLDDRRGLPGGGIGIGLNISKRPWAWEGIYHTSANQVVDVLCMALDQITQGGCGTVTSDSPRWQKDGVVARWLLTLGHSKKWRAVLTGTSESNTAH